MCGDASSVDGWVGVERPYDYLELGLHSPGFFWVTAQQCHRSYPLSCRKYTWGTACIPLLPSLLQDGDGMSMHSGTYGHIGTRHYYSFLRLTIGKGIFGTSVSFIGMRLS